MKYILVLGCETVNRMPFGGVFDYEKKPATDAEKELHAAIARAISQPDPLYSGEAEAEGIICDPSLYEPYPFDGKIDTAVCIYVD